MYYQEKNKHIFYEKYRLYFEQNTEDPIDDTKLPDNTCLPLYNIFKL